MAILLPPSFTQSAATPYRRKDLVGRLVTHHLLGVIRVIAACCS
jgi:hypothetical protein